MSHFLSTCRTKLNTFTFWTLRVTRRRNRRQCGRDFTKEQQGKKTNNNKQQQTNINNAIQFLALTYHLPTNSKCTVLPDIYAVDTFDTGQFSR